MVSADFTVNALSVPPEVAVAASSTVTLALLSVSGVNTVTWSIIGNHAEAAVNPTITPAGTPLGQTATFPMPSGDNQSYIVQCQINGGTDAEGVQQATYTKTALVGVNDANDELPFAFGESMERSATHGYTERLNAGSGGGGGDVTGPGSSVSGNIAVFDGTGGDALEDGGISIADLQSFPVMTIPDATTDLTTAHVGKYLRCTHVTPTLNYDGGIAANSLITGVGVNGPVTFTEDGTTINVEPTLTPVTRQAFAPFALKIVDTLEADLTGSLEPVP